MRWTSGSWWFLPAELKSGRLRVKRKNKALSIQRKRGRRARAAASKALADLPIPLPEDNSVKGEAFFDLVFAGLDGSSRRRAQDADDAPRERSRENPPTALPVHWEQGRRTTLINEAGYRVALTDPGAKDPNGRRIFYQEEWVQRGRVVLQKAQLVTVDTSTGQHVLIKRYPPREFTGSIDDVYSLTGLYETRSVKPPDVEPSRQEVESALARVARRSPEDLAAARQQYCTSALRADLARSDQRHADKGDSSLDAGLPDETRLRLYAIRGQLLHAALVLEGENDLQDETKKAEERIEELKRLAAWANRATPEDSRETLPTSEWDRIQTKADDAIYTARRATTSALASLPPDSTDRMAKFSALFKQGIVRMVSVRTSTESGFEPLVARNMGLGRPGLGSPPSQTGNRHDRRRSANRGSDPAKPSNAVLRCRS